MGEQVTYCAPCGVKRSINPSFNLLNQKTHLSPKANGFDKVHEKNLKGYLNKEIKIEKRGWKRTKKGETTMK